MNPFIVPACNEEHLPGAMLDALHAAGRAVGELYEWVTARSVLLIVAVVLATQNLSASAQPAVDDSAAVASAVRAFHETLARGDSMGALRLLAADAVIMENGGHEAREDYRAHHLPADIQFAQAVPTRRSAIKVTVSGDVAWASSTSVTQGTYRERTINSAGVELMVLSKTATGWVIRAIHWSSRTLRSGS